MKGQSAKAQKLDQIEIQGLPMGWGGKRPGSGRKPSAEKTKAIRVPVSLLDTVTALIKKHKSKGGRAYGRGSL